MSSSAIKRCSISKQRGAEISSLDLLCELGFQKSNILLVDSKGVINNQRENLTKEKLDYVSTTHKQTLADAMQDCDVFVGVASANLVSKDMVAHTQPQFSSQY
jgi:malic enzyme